MFGGFSSGSGSDISFNVGLINQSDSSFAKNFTNQLQNSKTFKVNKEVTTLDQAKDKMSRSEIDAAIVLPPDFGTVGSNGIPSGDVKVYYDQNNEQSAQALTAVLQSEIKNVNAKYVTIEEPFTVTPQSTNEKGLTKFDYTFAGLVGFSIMGLGVFGPVNYFPEMKKQGVLRRLHITPLRSWEYFVSSVLSNAVIGLFAIGIMFLVAIGHFHFHMVGNYFEMALFIVFSILSILELV